MRVKLQLVMCSDEGQEETVTDVSMLNKNSQRIEHLGLSLVEAKQLLSTLQRHLLQHQVDTFLDRCTTCTDCGVLLKVKAHASRLFRTLFGTYKLYSPRLEHCDCTRRKTVSFRPLSALLTESVAPELLYMEAKWSSLVAYGMSMEALKDFLPLEVTLDVKTVRYDTLKVAKRIEAELGDEHPCFIEGSLSDWDLLPFPEGAFMVGIDGGYVRNWCAKKHNFEVIVGKSTRACGENAADKTPSSKRFGFVQTLDTKPKRRLYEVLHSQGLQMNQDITILADGNDTLRALQLEMSPKATHILDWFHVTMRLTITLVSAKSGDFPPSQAVGWECENALLTPMPLHPRPRASPDARCSTPGPLWLPSGPPRDTLVRCWPEPDSPCGLPLLLALQRLPHYSPLAHGAVGPVC